MSFVQIVQQLIESGAIEQTIQVQFPLSVSIFSNCLYLFISLSLSIYLSLYVFHVRIKLIDCLCPKEPSLLVGFFTTKIYFYLLKLRQIFGIHSNWAQ